MKEFIDKLIERLEEEKEGYSDTTYYALGIGSAIKIVNKLAEEYEDKVIIDGQYCWQTCGATEHCKECNRLRNGSIDYYENYDFMAEEYKGGWIPCSERLPEETECYFVTWRDRATCKNYVEITEYDAGSQEWLDCICQAGLLGYDIIAWKPLPAPYTEGE